jgi:hypothetical protein
MLRMRPRVKFGSSSLQGPNKSAVDAKVRAVLATIVIILSWSALYTASLLFRSSGPVRYGIDVCSIVVELHRQQSPPRRSIKSVGLKTSSI